MARVPGAHNSHYLPVLLAASIGLVLSIAAFLQSLHWNKTQVEIAFREASQDRILVVQRELSHSLEVVRDIARFFQDSEFVGRREFRKFVGPPLKRQADIKALAWMPRVNAQDKQAFIDEARKSFPPFRITETDALGALKDAPSRDRYHPILYIQPYQENKEALGLNMGANETVSTLIKQSLETRSPQVSEGVKLIDETRDETGIVVVVPVYVDQEDTASGMALLSEPDESQLRGFALGMFFIGDIIERALESLLSGGVDLDFYQVADGEPTDRLYRHLSRLRDDNDLAIDAPPADISYRQRIEVGSQHWDILCQPAPNRFEINPWGSWIILLGGLAFTSLLTIYLGSLLGREATVRLEVEERTSQLRDAVTALNHEISERRSAERQLQRLNENLEQHVARRTAEAERRAQYLEQFAYVAAHDLKAPLRAVSNLAQWIEEDLDKKLDDTSREQLELLRDRVRRMHELIEGLLAYTRVGNAGDSDSWVYTEELLNEIIDSLAAPREFNIAIEGEMPVLYADRVQLGQVFSNLISNCLKHHGGERGNIRIGCANDGDIYTFSVCDDGRGIAPQYHDKIFMMFQVLETTDLDTSTGIGLAVVKKIVEEHGGSIRIHSAEGQGACFNFTWPKKSPREVSASADR